MATLLLEVDHGEAGADPMMARIAMIQALYAGKPVSTPEPRRRAVKKYRVIS